MKSSTPNRWYLLRLPKKFNSCIFRNSHIIISKTYKPVNIRVQSPGFGLPLEGAVLLKAVHVKSINCHFRVFRQSRYWLPSLYHLNILFRMIISVKEESCRSLMENTRIGSVSFLCWLQRIARFDAFVKSLLWATSSNFGERFMRSLALKIASCLRALARVLAI